MAPKPSAERLLAHSARLASARVSLALAAIAALAIAGCGGGGSSEEGQATSSSPTTAGQAPAKEAGTNSSPGAKAGSSHSAPQGSQGKEGSSAQANPQGQGAKHGAKVHLPPGAPEPTATPAEEAQATVADIALRIPNLAPQESLAPTNTCDGPDFWPTLEWQGVPADAKELVLFTMNAAPVGGKLFFDWAVAGLDPALPGIASAKLPSGAVVGKNSFGKVGYSVCPPQGTGETYVFALYAVPQRLSPKQGFDPASLREAVQGASRKAGLLAASYAR